MCIRLNVSKPKQLKYMSTDVIKIQTINETLIPLLQDVGKTKVKIEIFLVSSDTAPHLYRFQPYDYALLLFTLESFSSLCPFSEMQAPNVLRSIKPTAFSKAIQYLYM